MTVAFMRYIIETAGNLSKLHTAIEAVSKSPGNKDYAWELFRASSSPPGGRRAPEPHFSLARELGLIEENWTISVGAGRAFLRLWQDEKGPPLYTTLALLLQRDRSFLVPFLRGISRYSIVQTKEIGDSSARAWEEMWQHAGDDLRLIEPPVPRELSPRTLLHNGRARWRLLNGLGLKPQEKRGFAEAFHSYSFKRLPVDYFSTMAFSFTGRRPLPLPESTLANWLNVAFVSLKGIEFASTIGALYLINEKILPTSYVTHEQIVSLARRSDGFEVQPAYSSEEFLFKVR